MKRVAKDIFWGIADGMNWLSHDIGLSLLTVFACGILIGYLVWG